MAADDPRDELVRFLTPSWRSDFFQTVKLIEYAERARRNGDGPSVTTPGAGDDPEREPIRFSSKVHLSFSTSDMSGLDLDPKDGGPPVLTVDFMGLAGARGPMPLWLASMVRDRSRLGDSGLQDFLDVLNHRLVSMLWRIRQKFRPGLHTGPLHLHDYSLYLQAFTGLRTDAAREVFNLDPGNYDPEGDDELVLARDLVFYAGLFWQHDRSMQGLERLLDHYFGLPVRGMSCQGHWIHLEESSRTALSVEPRNNRLGVTAIAGRRVWDQQAGFAIELGPLEWDDFIEFLPIGRRWPALFKMVGFYTRNAFSFSLRLRVRPQDIHGSRPGISTNPFGARLGWTSWLTTRGVPSEPPPVVVSGRRHTLDDQVEPVETLDGA